MYPILTITNKGYVSYFGVHFQNINGHLLLFETFGSLETTEKSFWSLLQVSLELKKHQDERCPKIYKIDATNVSDVTTYYSVVTNNENW